MPQAKWDNIPYRDSVYPTIDPSQYSSTSFTDKVVLVTGSGRGIGKELGLAFSKLGAKVCFTDLTLEPAESASQEAQEKYGNRTFAVKADIRIFSEIENLVRQTESTLGPVDILINNAGYGDFGTFDVFKPEDYWDVVTLNLKGPMDVTRLILPSMIQRNSGVIICNTTTGAVDNYPYTIPYMVAKTGQAKFIHCLWHELQALKATNIKLFHIHPGAPPTRMGDPNYAMRPYAQEANPELKKWVFDYLPSLQEDIGLGVWTMVFLAAGKANALDGRYINANHDIGEVLKRMDQVERYNMYTLKADTFNAVKDESAAKALARDSVVAERP